MNPLQPIGRVVINFLATVGRLTMFMASALSHCVRPPFYPRIIVRQMVEIGYYSLPVVGLTGVFAGIQPKAPLPTWWFYPSPVNWGLYWPV